MGIETQRLEKGRDRFVKSHSVWQPLITEKPTTS
jgi:hypothetical protein